MNGDKHKRPSWTGPDQTKYTGEHKLLSSREVTIATCVQAIQIQQAATVTLMEQAVEIQQSAIVTSMEQVILKLQATTVTLRATLALRAAL